MYSNPARRAGVVFTYSMTTPESVEEGDYAEHGYYYPGGYYDEYSKVTDHAFYLLPARSVSEVVSMIEEQLGTRPEPSSSHFHPGVWYTQVDGDQDYRTGEVTYKSAHLKGFTPREEAWIFTALTGKHVRRANPARRGRGAGSGAPVLSDAERQKINLDLAMRGADGNGSFRGTSHGISTVFSVLSAYGIQPVDVLSGDLFLGERGHRALRVGVSMSDDPFMPPVEFENTLLVFSWYRRQSGSYEILAYLS